MLRILFFVYCLNLVRSTPIDNGVEGDPEIECAANSITVNFNTRNDFQGHVYVKGRFNEPGCKSDEGGRRTAGIKLGFDACGTQRSRSLNPKGVFVQNTVVITFHPQFLTKVDRAYTIQCFYMEADKTVSQDLEVSEITTAFQTQTVPMPVCQYDILEGGPEGQAVKFATIGQQVYHKWTCTTETTDIFCAVVHSCFVDDGAGNHQQLLDENGCAIDKFLLQNLEYINDLSAGRESHVFKYADKPALFFQCQVSISIKEPGQQCSRPQCGEPGGPKGVLAGPAPNSQGSANSQPPRGTSPRPPTSRISRQPPTIGNLGGRGLFLAPLQSLLANAGGSSAASRSLPQFTIPPNRLPPLLRSTTSTLAPATPALAPESTASANRTSTSTTQSTSTSSGASSGSSSSSPEGPPSSAKPLVNVAELANSDINVPVNLGPAPGGGLEAIPNQAGNLDFPDRRRRLKRSTMANEIHAGTWDLRAQPITALDIDNDILDDSQNRRSQSKRHNLLDEILEKRPDEQSFCLTPVALALFIASTLAFSILTVILAVLWLRRSSKY